MTTAQAILVLAGILAVSALLISARLRDLGRDIECHSSNVTGELDTLTYALDPIAEHLEHLARLADEHMTERAS